MHVGARRNLVIRPQAGHLSDLLPPRSMAGQLTLDQHIGVRIPGGQPIRHTAFQSRPKFQPSSKGRPALVQI